MRLIRCDDCLTLEAIPDLTDPDPEAPDPLLRRVVSTHIGPLNREQLRKRPPNAPRVRDIQDDEMHRSYNPDGKAQGWAIFNVQNDDWRDEEKRKRIVEQLWSDHTGYPVDFYSYRDQFREDAVNCFYRHGSPGSDSGPHSCIDYHADSKRLTDLQWRQRGDSIGQPRDHVYLCEWCPYTSVVVTRKRTARGDYDK